MSENGISHAAALVVVLAFLMVGCGGELEPSPPPTDVSEGDAPGLSLCTAGEGVEEAMERLLQGQLAGGELAADGLTDEPLSRDEVRAAAEALNGVGEAILGLRPHVDQRLHGPLETMAEPYVELAGMYAELDYDFANIDGLDDEDVSRLGDAALPWLFGQELSAQERAALDELAATVDEACPDMDLELLVGPLREADTAEGPVDPDAILDGHTVRLSDEAVAQIRESADNTVALFRDDPEDRVADDEPCPLWDPDAVVAALDDLVDGELHPSATIQGRSAGGRDADAWLYTCDSIVRCEDGHQGGEQGDLEVQAMPVGGLAPRLEDAEPDTSGGHAIWERQTTSFDQPVHEAAAADLDSDLAVVVRAGSPEIARVTLVTVLDRLGTS